MVKVYSKRSIKEMNKRFIYNQIWREFKILSKNIRKANSLDNIKSSLGIVYSLMGNNRYSGNFHKERAILNEFVKTLGNNKSRALDKFDLTIANKNFER